MAYVKAATSSRARKFLATSEGRRQLLQVYLGTSDDKAVKVERAAKTGQFGDARVTSDEQPNKK